MKFKFLFVFVFINLCFNFSLFAQQTGLITGTVVDVNTNKPITGATVVAGEKLATAVSDSTGRFRMTVPVGTYQLSASCIGYVKLLKYNILVGSGSPQLVNFDLQPQST